MLSLSIRGLSQSHQCENWRVTAYLNHKQGFLKALVNNEKSEDTDLGEQFSLSMNAFHTEAASGGLGRCKLTRPYAFSSLSDNCCAFPRERRKHQWYVLKTSTKQILPPWTFPKGNALCSEDAGLSGIFNSLFFWDLCLKQSCLGNGYSICCIRPFTMALKKETEDIEHVCH